VIYPVAGVFKYEDTDFTVHASDAEGEGKEPLKVNVSTSTAGKAAVIGVIILL
jgi:hypothetical protein